MVVSKLLFDAVREALRAAQLTGGAVDPTVGQALVAHRINPPLSEQPVRIEPVPGYTVVKLDQAKHTIRLPPARSSTLVRPPRRWPRTWQRRRGVRGRRRQCSRGPLW